MLHKRTVDLAPTLVCGVLAVALIVDGFLTFGGERLSRNDASAAAELQRSRMLEARPNAAGSALRTVIAAHVFGVAPPELSPSAATTPTEMTLALTGIIALHDPHQGFAIIGDKPSGSRTYVVGAPLPTGARVSAIYPDRVVIERDGVFESLRLPKGTRAMLQAAGRRRLPAIAAPVEVSDDSVPSDPREFSKARSWFGGFMAEPYAPHGTIVGYQALPRQGYARDYGVQRGDLITAINGVALDSLDSAATVLQHVTGDTVTLTVLRNGVSQDLNLQLDN